MAILKYILIIIAILLVFAFLSFIIKFTSKRLTILASVIAITILSILSILIVYMNYTVNISSKIKVSAKEKELKEEKKRIRNNIIIRPGAVELISLHLSYSNRISVPIIKNRELGFYLDNTWFNWADGKLLKDEDMPNRDEYINFGFYSYSLDGLPKLPEASEEMTREFEDSFKRRINSRKTINDEFLNTLYDGNTSRNIFNNIMTMSVLGYRTQVHEFIQKPLSNANAEVFALAQTNEEVKKFLSSLKTVSGYVWKMISKSSSKSYHSYGAAFDTLPRRNGGKQIYWAWTRVNNKNWYAVPYEDRWHPPKDVIKIFEKHGFIWGGKWNNYDTIHFEYRPELIIYNRIKDDENAIYDLIEKYGLY